MEHQKSEFAARCKALRQSRNLKHREVAAVIGIKTETYGNVETSPWKVIGRDKAERLAELYVLGGAERAELLAAWERCPLSPSGVKRQAWFAKQRGRRDKLRHYDRLKLSLVEMVSLELSHAQGRFPCTCLFGGGTEYDPTRNCEICEALEALEIPAGLDEVRLAGRLDKLQTQLETQLKIGSKHETGTTAARVTAIQG